ncbi:MAG: hypothetical protein DRN95_07630 [Candidatus Hydrothermarchaeota archaeon]|nr:MAG: hypothetical protein DRN95_07630 [Candidatus Hydrothermarchaeota archaeon]
MREPVIHVKNKRHGDDGIYVGRPTPLGNPFKETRDGTRDEVIEKYRPWLLDQLDSDNSTSMLFLRLFELLCREGELTLVCWCAPKRCHAEVIRDLLLEAWHELQEEPINNFWGDFRFLSNFYLSDFEWKGQVWPSVEHAYQASKTHDLNLREHIRGLEKPNAAKRVGKMISCRSDWESIKRARMLELVRAKFGQSVSLMTKLLATGSRELIEGNTWHDCEWGVCTCPDCGSSGKNWLGLILMQVRTELQKRGCNGL